MVKRGLQYEQNKSTSERAGSLADVALLEAVKVRMQTTLMPYVQNLREWWSKAVSGEECGGLAEGLCSLWARQVPYTMVEFATFERTVEHVSKLLGKPVMHTPCGCRRE